jgi:hypothetical protein
MATTPPKTPQHRPAALGPRRPRSCQPLGNHSVDDGGQILRGGGRSGPLIKAPYCAYNVRLANWLISPYPPSHGRNTGSNPAGDTN